MTLPHAERVTKTRSLKSDLQFRLQKLETVTAFYSFRRSRGFRSVRLRARQMAQESRLQPI
jgi:hypothetical protein